MEELRGRDAFCLSFFTSPCGNSHPSSFYSTVFSFLTPFLTGIKEDILIFRSFILILDSYRAAKHNWLNKRVCRSSENCDSHPLSSLYFLHSLKMVHVSSSPTFTHTCLHTQLYSRPLHWHKINTARTLIKCYLQLAFLTPEHDKSNVRFFSSNLAVNPVYGVMLRKWINPHGINLQETGMLSTSVRCLPLKESLS